MKERLAAVRPGHASASPYDTIRVTLAAVFVLTAVLRGCDLATESVGSTGSLASCWLAIAVVEFELLFGLWLLSNVWAGWARRVALLYFGLFAAISLSTPLSGAVSCGCFGRLAPNPWCALVFGVAVVVALIRWRPLKPRPLLFDRNCPAAFSLVQGLLVTAAFVWPALAAVFVVPMNTRADQLLTASPSGASGWDSRTATDLIEAAGYPARVRSLKRVPVELNGDDVTRAVGKLRTDRFPGMSILLHSAMVFGLDMEVPEYPSPDCHPTLKQVVFDCKFGKEYFKDGPVLVETSWGLRNRVQVRRDRRWQNERQAHPGQLLAELAKHGVPLEQELLTEAGVFRVRDMVRHTVANYNHEGRQIEWICMALTLYLPPRTTWVDKFGRRYSFDDMAEELMQRKFDSEGIACHGIHLLEALVLLFRLDAKHDILSDVYRERVGHYLADHVARLVRTQRADGSWGENWNSLEGAAGSQKDDSEADLHVRVHVTGHHVDWMLLLPADMMPPEDVFRRAVPWLQRCLLECDEEEIIDYYCPYSHAAHVLTVLAPETRHADLVEDVAPSGDSTLLPHSH